MGAPYTSQSSPATYNQSPPPDDGTESDANRVKWATIKTKLADALKTFGEGINSELLLAFAKVPGGGGITSTATTYTVQTSDQGNFVVATAAVTITTPAAATVGSPFVFAVQNNSTGAVTLDGNASETIDGLASVKLPPGRGFFVQTDGTNWFTSGRGRFDNLVATTSPAVTNDTDEGYSVGSLWIDVTNDQAYVCLDATDGAAVWRNVSDQITSGTAQTASPQTSVGFSNIPSGTKKIIVSISELSTDGTSPITLRLGDSGGLEATNYSSVVTQIADTTVGGTNVDTTGFSVAGTAAAAVWKGAWTLTLVDSSTNTWTCTFMLARSDSPITDFGAGTKALSGELTQLTVTTEGGTDNFDAGTINILYQ